MKEELSISKQTQLKRFEKIFEAGRKTAGQALKAIHDKQLYKPQWPTFKAYCQERWNIGSNAAYYLIEATEARIGMSKILDIGERKLLSQTSDSTVRELAKVPKRSRAKVFREAVAKSDGEAPTCERVHEIASPKVRTGSKAKIAELEASLDALPRGGLAAEARRAKIEKELKMLRGEDEPAKSNGDGPWTHEPTPAKLRVQRPPMLDVPTSGWKVRVLEAFDREIEAHLDTYRSVKAMAVAIRALLVAL